MGLIKDQHGQTFLFSYLLIEWYRKYVSEKLEK